MRTIRAIVEREGKFWLIRMPELDAAGFGEATTQARFPAEIEPMARDCAALILDVDMSEIEIEVIEA